MNPGVPVAFLQLTKNPRRLLIALAGVVISALGILCQMGFEDSLFRSATRLYDELDADLVVISPQYQFMVLPAQFSERRLVQALSVPGVESISSLRLGIAPFKNPLTRINRNVYVVGITPAARVFANPEWAGKTRLLDAPDAVLFDAHSRPEFGPIAELFREANTSARGGGTGAHGGGVVRTELANQQIRVIDLFEMGASFSADGTVITTDEGFSRIFPQRRRGLVDIGLVHLSRDVAAKADATDAVIARLRSTLAEDVLVMTHAAFNAREQAYWRTTTPAGFIFKIIMVLSLLVGSVSAYQILFSDISENLRQYAALKAIGYPDSYFVTLTFEKAWLLSSLGYPVGFLIAQVIYFGATSFTLVPLVMTPARAVGVYAIVFASSCAAGIVATGRLRRADVSELF
jgi:putative ABC transport system permease protein